MSRLRVNRESIRKSFGKIGAVVPVPNLIQIQSSSFNNFVQLDCLSEERKNMGLQKVLSDVFPIEHADRMSLEYVSYELGAWECTCGKLSGIENRYTWHCSKTGKSGCSRLSEDQKTTARYKTCQSCLSRVRLKMPLTLEECRSSGQTFSLPLRVKIQLITWMVDEQGNRNVQDIKEQNIFFADIPVMADLYEEDGQYRLGSFGTFLINGIDRVTVSQLHRSPGVVFSQSKKTKDLRGRPYFLARVIPMNGSWIDFEFDSNENLYVRIDKKKKLLVTTFLQALGYDRDQIIPLFYQSEKIIVGKEGFHRSLEGDSLFGVRIEKGSLPEKLEKKFVGKRVDATILGELKQLGLHALTVRPASLVNHVLAYEVIHPKTGEVIGEQGQVLTKDTIDLFLRTSGLSFEIIKQTGYIFHPTIVSTLDQDKCTTREQALKEFHSKIWAGDTAALDEIQQRVENIFFNPRTYDLTRVGRIRMNRKLNLNIPEDFTALTKEDIVQTIAYLIGLRERGEGELDDIDHLGNRRVRLVGELLTNRVQAGFARIERIARERLRMQEPHSAMMPQDFLNVKPLGASLREFFSLGQLSQYMDETNPLSMIAQLRRLSALGPGGVMKDRATYEIRDVHTSHYGRICPIETPEGQTIGLISSLATYAMVNDLGFIETAYRPVVDGKIEDNVVFMDAFEEADQYIAQADVVAGSTDKNKKLSSEQIFARHQGNFLYISGKQINYIDLSPQQLVSVSSALIPFLEHDDASRALMGANMQRQAVPLINPEAPIVGTGMEIEIGRSTGAVLTARRTGVVQYVSSEKIIILADEGEFTHLDDWLAFAVDTYHLRKFEGSSYSTWVHHRPIVKVGQCVKTGDILTDGPAITAGELALGTNLLVAFMPWHGYNFEDAIVLNKSLVASDALTSVHIEEFAAEARDTKLGPEEITRDIPNVAESALAGLDDDGIVRVGTRVKSGDILVGKVTLKGDIQFSPEEKLLRAIFGEKSREVRDTSLRVPPGIEGTIVDVKILSRSGIRKDRRYKREVAFKTEKIERDYLDHIAFLEAMVSRKMAHLLSSAKPATSSSKSLLTKDGMFDREELVSMSISELRFIKVIGKKENEQLKLLIELFDNQLQVLDQMKQERIARFKKGDPLPSGVIKMVKIYIAMKRPIQAGDKLAGRHGNKGVVSTLVPREDMPFMEDGTPVDIVLNPLGVPSRMNVGQILETALGLVGKTLGKKVAQALENGAYDAVFKQLSAAYSKDLVTALEEEYGQDAVLDLARKSAKVGISFSTPIFDGADWETDIQPMLKELDLPESGSFRIIDGRTGQYFEQPVTVGSIYMMKLNHMVDDKLHARSVGPYSLVTQQPLGGKAQMGGQRLGEMEVWALEAYGAAYTLQEMLTYKSDDVTGRDKVYQAIVRREPVPEPGVPESFNVLVKELQSLALQVDLFKSGKETDDEK